MLIVYTKPHIKIIMAQLQRQKTYDHKVIGMGHIQPGERLSKSESAGVMNERGKRIGWYKSIGVSNEYYHRFVR